MIVSDNANLYGTLFEKANAALGFVTYNGMNAETFFIALIKLVFLFTTL